MENGKLLRKLLSPHWGDLSPLEAKIYITLYWLADPDSGEVLLSLFRLSRRVNIMTRLILPHLEKLQLRGLISFTSDSNPLLDSQFKILIDEELAQENEIQYIPVAPNGEKDDGETVNAAGNHNGNRNNDPDKDNGFIKNNKTNGNNGNNDNNGNRSVKKDNKKTGKTGTENDGATVTGASQQNFPDMSSLKLTPGLIARELNDEKNLALYEAYIARYPEAIIHRAFWEVHKTPPERIKKSAGAFFTFLVKKYGNPYH
jgi:hypothetical protein